MTNTAVEYRYNLPLEPREVARLYAAAGIPRPTDDLPRMARMLAAADLLLSAWDGARLVAVLRAITDRSYCCYISELAVDPAYQKRGIGAELLRRAQEDLGEEVSLILLSMPDAMDYYPRRGYTLAGNAFVLKRKR